MDTSQLKEPVFLHIEGMILIHSLPVFNSEFSSSASTSHLNYFTCMLVALSKNCESFSNSLMGTASRYS